MTAEEVFVARLGFRLLSRSVFVAILGVLVWTGTLPGLAQVRRFGPVGRIGTPPVTRGFPRSPVFPFRPIFPTFARPGFGFFRAFG